MQITWFGHSAFRLEFSGSVIMIDPFLSGSPVFSGDALQAAEGCTHVLLTHGHDDHIGDTAAICRETGAQLVSNPEICGHLHGQGVQNVNPGNMGGTVDCGGFTVSFTQALHSSSSNVDGRPLYLGNPMGLIIRGEGQPVVYAMGDTDVFGDMALINEFHRPEVGLVPIGDRFTMGARGAALACRRFFDFRAIVPCHFGTFPMIDQTAEKFLSEMGDDASKVVLAQHGKPFEV
ncbi:L-ascorbate metabolism protein UlaG, beta-lactamase superfamily [Faunimonas pinastri]|uniref:UPF0173 metal-dependent hydrolase SAMN05216548_11086 n=1 Tax=Faunimonas pinastri TaxID=1855383 RepID=A0A1H9KTW9_9HYPH|nr:metal-dependent hydrolase [Faunimonas pinastri]SER02606.1 L-ascorbate metabolism protein UlaG, beta-lactamase superfamily [Faunimonas pinastri]